MSSDPKIFDYLINTLSDLIKYNADTTAKKIDSLGVDIRNISDMLGDMKANIKQLNHKAALCEKHRDNSVTQIKKHFYILLGSPEGRKALSEVITAMRNDEKASRWDRLMESKTKVITGVITALLAAGSIAFFSFNKIEG